MLAALTDLLFENLMLDNYFTVFFHSVGIDNHEHFNDIIYESKSNEPSANAPTLS